MKKRCLATVLSLLLLFAALLCGCADPTPDCVRIEILDVDQSDCTLITQGEQVLMIDTGTVTERHSVQGALHKRGVDRIDLLVLTHAHEDHIGNARMILETYTVGGLIVPSVDDPDPDFKTVLKAAEERGVPITVATDGQCLKCGDMTVEFLKTAYSNDDPNNGSMVLKVIYGETAALFTGDNEKKGEKALLESVPPERLRCDLLKAGHHGSSNATGEALLDAVAPRYVAISCGRYNSYGFPAYDLVDRLNERGIEWHSTDSAGTLCYVSDGKSIWYEE